MSASSPKHPIFERFYGWISPRMDEGGVAAHRRQLLAGLSGRVIEVGSGNGLNFAHYPPEVSRVIAVEPSIAPPQARTGQRREGSRPD